MRMDSTPITAKLLSRHWGVKAKNFERAYKDSLSAYRQWEQLDHAETWMLLPQNIGISMSIDETSLNGELYTILTNKEGHGKKGTIVAMIKGTRVPDIIRILLMLPEEQRLAVSEVSMDFSESMAASVRKAFPNAAIVVDCFHVVKRCGEAVEELRLRSKREAIKERKKEEAEHKKMLARRVAMRKAYRKKHPKKYRGKKRGRKPARLNARYTPEILSNGDTKVELLTRSRGLLLTSAEKWSSSQKERARLLFEHYPKIKEAYGLVNSLRAVFRNHDIGKDEARKKLYEWYQKVTDCTLREIKSARDTIKAREDEVLNYFFKWNTNASAESFNSKIKNFRAQLRGVVDMPFFMYRLSVIFG